jgi:hypothetical protein
MNEVNCTPCAIHLHAAEVMGTSNSDAVNYIFAGVAAPILITNINFINPSIAQSIGRIKETACKVRAGRKQIISIFANPFHQFPAFLLAISRQPWRFRTKSTDLSNLAGGRGF